MDADLARDRGDRARRAARRADPLQVALRVPDRARAGGSTRRSAAYAAIKYAERDRDGARRDPDVPARAHARLDARGGRRALASLCTTAFFYAGFLLPEVARVSRRSRSAPGSRSARSPAAGAAGSRPRSSLDLVATEVRSELDRRCRRRSRSPRPVLWVVGPRGQRMRRGWSAATTPAPRCCWSALRSSSTARQPRTRTSGRP